MFRIGINVGDVVVEDGDLLGDGVNIAARLEALAEPGGICIADAVQKQLAGKTDFAFEDTGERTLKNIAQPVRVWRWAKEPSPAAAGAPLPLPDRPSIAVLPFDNLSGQPEETYFSDGITEDIITGLARFRSLFVIARNSSFAFRGKAIEMAEIGRRLGVSYLLEGSVRRAGARVRITAQLIEAATGAHLWAERYDRSLDDIFAVQDEVAQTIVSTLVGRIEDARLQQSLRRPHDQPGSLRLLLARLGPLSRRHRNRQSAGPRDVREGGCARSTVCAWRIRTSRWRRWHSTVTPPHRPRFWKRRSRRQSTRSNSTPRRAAATEYCRPSASIVVSTTWPSNISGGHSTSIRTMTDVMTQKGRVLALRGRSEEALVLLEAADPPQSITPPLVQCSFWYCPLFASALRRGRPGAQTHVPRQPPGRARGSQPATPSLGRTAEAQVASEQRSCGCSLTSRRRSTCARASCLNTPRTGSFSAKGSSRPDCRRDLVRAPAAGLVELSGVVRRPA